MKRIALVLAALIAIPLSASAFCNDWRTSDTVLAASYSALLYVDWRQTKQFISTAPDVREENPVIGSHPSGSAVDQYSLSALAGLLIACFLHDEIRTTWLGGLTAVEIYAVNRNNQHGFSGGLAIRF